MLAFILIRLQIKKCYRKLLEITWTQLIHFIYLCCSSQKRKKIYIITKKKDSFRRTKHDESELQIPRTPSMLANRTFFLKKRMHLIKNCISERINKLPVHVLWLKSYLFRLYNMYMYINHWWQAAISSILWVRLHHGSTEKHTRKAHERQRWDPFSSFERSDIWNKETSYVSTSVWDRQTERPNTPSQINRPRRVGSLQDDSFIHTQENRNTGAHTHTHRLTRNIKYLYSKLPQNPSSL